MSEIIVKDQIEKTVGDTTYMITAFPTFVGLSVRRNLSEGNGQDPLFIRRLVLDAISVNGLKKDDAWFDNHFSRRYLELDELIKEILEFNFPELVGKLNDSPE